MPLTKDQEVAFEFLISKINTASSSLPIYKLFPASSQTRLLCEDKKKQTRLQGFGIGSKGLKTLPRVCTHFVVPPTSPSPPSFTVGVHVSPLRGFCC
jgi:hypothetical protein